MVKQDHFRICGWADQVNIDQVILTPEQAWMRWAELKITSHSLDAVLIETKLRPNKLTPENRNHMRPRHVILARSGKGRAWFEPPAT